MSAAGSGRRWPLRRTVVLPTEGPASSSPAEAGGSGAERGSWTIRAREKVSLAPELPGSRGTGRDGASPSLQRRIQLRVDPRHGGSSRLRQRLPFKSSATSASSGTQSSWALSSGRGVSHASYFLPSSRRQWRGGLKRASLVFEGVAVTAVIVACTLLALVLEDIRTALLPPTLDLPCAYVTIGLMVILGIDTLLACCLRPLYFPSFFFFIDCCGVSNLVLDLPPPWVFAALPGAAPQGHPGDSIFARQPGSAFWAQIVAIVRLLLMTRAMRLVRLLRLYQRYEAAVEHRRFQAQLQGKASETDAVPRWWQRAHHSSRVGRSFINAVTRFVLCAVIIFPALIPLFYPASPFYDYKRPYAQGGLLMLHSYCVNNNNATVANLATAGYVRLAPEVLFGQETAVPLAVVLCNATLYLLGPTAGQGLRTQELLIITEATSACGGGGGGSDGGNSTCLQSAAYLDVSWTKRADALLSLGRTLFLLLALALYFWGFSGTALRMVIRPIDRMLDKVREVAASPLQSHQNSAKRQAGKREDGDLETGLLIRTLDRICSLLVIGFGEAGAEVISRNLTDEGQLDAMCPGQRGTAIFAFCDIRRFTDATEVLQTDIMEYVNTIASLVHMETALHGGAPNKNVGDAFLLVWKFSKDFRYRILTPWPLAAAAAADAAAAAAATGGGGGGGSGPRHSSAEAAGSSSRPSAALGGQPAEAELSWEAQQALQPSLLQGSSAGWPGQQGPHGGHARPPGGPGQGLPSLQPLRSPRTSLEQKQQALNLRSDGGRTAGAAAGPGAGPGAGAAAAWVPSVPGLPDPKRTSQEKRRSQERRRGRGGPGLKRSLEADPEALVHRFPHSQATFLPMPGSLQEARSLADKALATSIVVQAMLRRSPRLQDFCQRADLQARMPGFEVNMGFGLHVGWAIEGAIGSEHKIDVSYLSPHVNLASRLEGATKQYGVSILLSGDFASVLSPSVQERIRQVDCVTIQGSPHPLGLFTYDTVISGDLLLDDEDASLDDITFSGRPYRWEFAEHPDLTTTWAVGRGFVARYHEGLQHYIAGEWDKAQQPLQDTLTWRRDRDGHTVLDGPSRVLLDFMRDPHNFVAPKDWPGHRPLAEH